MSSVISIKWEIDSDKRIGGSRWKTLSIDNSNDRWNI